MSKSIFFFFQFGIYKITKIYSSSFIFHVEVVEQAKKNASKIMSNTWPTWAVDVRISSDVEEQKLCYLLTLKKLNWVDRDTYTR